MKAEEFDGILQNRVLDLQEVLSIKGIQYADETDRLKNFKDAARFQGCEPEQALLGFVSKHVIALKDFIAQVEDNQVPYHQWDEKIGDIIAYLVLLDALLKERGVKPPDVPC